MNRLLLAAVAAISLCAPAMSATLVTGARLLDPQSGRYMDNPAILISDDGDISSVANAATLQVPEGTKRIDLPGYTLLPGLIDMHTHLGPADIGGYRFLEYTDSFWPIVATA